MFQIINNKKMLPVFLNALIVLSIFFFFSFNFYAYVVWDTWVPDEKWFLGIVKHYKALSNTFELSNNRGYGYIYWLITFLFSSLKPLRLLNYFYLIVVFFLFIT